MSRDMVLWYLLVEIVVFRLGLKMLMWFLVEKWLVMVCLELYLSLMWMWMMCFLW